VALTPAVEESIDVEMVSAACPLCHIDLVEANSNQVSDMLAADRTAASLSGVTVVSNSWQAAEFAAEASDAVDFEHPNVAFVASAGDYGYGTGFPAVLPQVISVGGTVMTPSGASYSEVTWPSTGSGCAQDLLSATLTQSESTLDATLGHPCGTPDRRLVNDVAAVASGVSTYVSNNSALFDIFNLFTGGSTGWSDSASGTSLSAPLIAGIIALAANGGPPITPGDLYSAPASAFHDVTAGDNGVCRPAVLCHAEVGYDGPTGLGTPDGLTAFTPPGGSGVVVYNNDAEEQQSFADLGTATGEKVTVTQTLPSGLGTPTCVILDLTQAPFTSTQESTLTAYMKAGGKVLALGDWGPGFDPTDDVINKLAADLGLNVAINEDSHDSDFFTSSVFSTPLTAGVSRVFYSLFSSVTAMTPAVVMMDAGLDDGGGPIVAEEPVGAGFFAVSGDSDMFADDASAYGQGADNAVLAADICGTGTVASSDSPTIAAVPTPLDAPSSGVLTTMGSPAS
jgi:hypothetical protein